MILSLAYRMVFLQIQEVFLMQPNSTNTLRLSPKVAGITLSGTAYFIIGYVTGTIQTISTPQRGVYYLRNIEQR